jgi:hypothetical protein
MVKKKRDDNREGKKEKMRDKEKDVVFDFN